MNAKRVLVIEDEYLIAAEMESILIAAGAQTVESTATIASALRMIQECQWDAVVADANLNGRSVEPIATALAERHVPLVLVTGYGKESLPAELKKVPTLSKPFRAPQLLELLDQLAPRANSSGALQ